MTATHEVQVIHDPDLSAFATAVRRYDFFHALSDSAAVDIEGGRVYAELIRIGRTLPLGDVLAIWELKCRREYGDEPHWRKVWGADPVPRAMLAFEMDLRSAR